MATYTLIPSSLTNYKSVTNRDRAYTDTSSTTYATVTVDNYDTYLGGFDFSVIPDDEIVTAITIRAKWRKASSSPTVTAFVVSSRSSSSGIVLSQTVTGTTTATVYTFTLNGDVDTIMTYASTLCVAFHYGTSSGTSAYIYGADITVTTSPRQPNKVVYGNNTVIDLTSDTVTASDVVSGKIFHLPSGIQATGTFAPKFSSTTLPDSGSGYGKTMSFSVAKEPSRFICVPYSSSNLFYIYYNGSTITTYYISSGTTTHSTTYTSLSYSSGTLTLTTTQTLGFGLSGMTWHMYYLL